MLPTLGEACANALTIYGNIKYLAKNEQPGAQAAYDDLSQRFPGRPAKARRAPFRANRNAASSGSGCFCCLGGTYQA